MRTDACRGAAAWLLCTLGLGTLLTAQAAGFRLNTTPSMPVGIWRARDVVPAAITRGMIVTYCLPVDRPDVRTAVERGYVGSGSCPGGLEPLLKTVAAVAGDVVTVTADGMTVNGLEVQASAPLDHDTADRPLGRVAPGRYQVAAGEIWLIAGHDPRSWDSRYLGPLPSAGVLQVAMPVLVFP